MCAYRIHKSLEKRIYEFWSKVDKSGGDNTCWIWQGSLIGKKRKIGVGYGTVNWVGGKKLATHVMYELTYGISPGSLFVCHSCDNPRCVNPKHFFLGTNQDNMDDMMTKGRNAQPHGEAHKSHKLSDQAVLEIRDRTSKGETYANLAREFGVCINTIGMISRRETRKYLS